MLKATSNGEIYDFKWPEVPDNANRFGTRPEQINPYDKYERGVHLSPKETAALEGVCGISDEQIIVCHSHINSFLNRYDFDRLCENCVNHLPPNKQDYYNYTDTLLSQKSNPFFDTTELSWINESSFVTRKDFEFAKDIGNDKDFGFIYFISDGEFIKIGKADNVPKRLDALQTSNARVLTLLYYIVSKDAWNANQIESALHKAFESFHSSSNEWFDIKNLISTSKKAMYVFKHLGIDKYIINASEYGHLLNKSKKISKKEEPKETNLTRHQWLDKKLILDIQEASELTGLSKRYLTWLCKAGELPFTIGEHKKKLIERKCLDECIKKLELKAKETVELISRTLNASEVG